MDPRPIEIVGHNLSAISTVVDSSISSESPSRGLRYFLIQNIGQWRAFLAHWREVRETLDDEGQNRSGIIGLDAEWNFKQVKGVQIKIAMLQLALPNRLVGLLHLWNFWAELSEDRRKDSFFFNSLQEFLSEPILKVGLSIYNDAKLLKDAFGLRVVGWIDIRYLAIRSHVVKRATDNFRGSLCLAELIRIAFNTIMSKEDHVRKSVWTVDNLTREQLEYAAVDGMAGLAFFFYACSPAAEYDERLVRYANSGREPFWLHSTDPGYLFNGFGFLSELDFSNREKQQATSDAADYDLEVNSTGSALSGEGIPSERPPRVDPNQLEFPSSPNSPTPTVRNSENIEPPPGPSTIDPSPNSGCSISSLVCSPPLETSSRSMEPVSPLVDPAHLPDPSPLLVFLGLAAHTPVEFPRLFIDHLPIQLVTPHRAYTNPLMTVTWVGPLRYP